MNLKINKPGEKKFTDMLIRTLEHLFLHNGWFKLMALVISLFLWAGLLSQDETLTRDKTFNNVSVNVTGEDSMKRNGYIVVSDLNEALKDITAFAAVPQKQYDSAEVSAYNIRVDLSRLNGTGVQELKLQSSNSTNFGRITSISPSSVPVTVEEYIVRYRIPVSVAVTGETEPGWYMTTPSVDPPLVIVSGPRSLVNDISRARVFLSPDEIEWNEGTSIMTGPLSLYNRSGEEVVSDLLEISYEGDKLDSVVLEFNILPTRTFHLDDMIGTLNNVADGFEVKDIHCSPETITVAARQEVLDQMTELALSDRFVDLNNLSETTTFQIRVSKPSEDAVLSNDTITVTVQIGTVEGE